VIYTGAVQLHRKRVNKVYNIYRHIILMIYYIRWRERCDWCRARPALSNEDALLNLQLSTRLARRRRTTPHARTRPTSADPPPFVFRNNPLLRWRAFIYTYVHIISPRRNNNIRLISKLKTTTIIYIIIYMLHCTRAYVMYLLPCRSERVYLLSIQIDRFCFFFSIVFAVKCLLL